MPDLLFDFSTLKLNSLGVWDKLNPNCFNNELSPQMDNAFCILPNAGIEIYQSIDFSNVIIISINFSKFSNPFYKELFPNFTPSLPLGVFKGKTMFGTEFIHHQNNSYHVFQDLCISNTFSIGKAELENGDKSISLNQLNTNVHVIFKDGCLSRVHLTY